jgi:hypothetical protein
LTAPIGKQGGFATNQDCWSSFAKARDLSPAYVSAGWMSQEISMKTYLAAAAILFASAGAASSQSVLPVPCIDDQFAVTADSCSNEPGLGFDDNGPGTLDNNDTSSIEQPSMPMGIAPLTVPNDPLGNNIANNPFGGGPVPDPETNTTIGTGGITTPLIQSP